MTEMHAMMDEMTMTAVRRWQDTFPLGRDDDDDDDDDVKTSVDMEHYDK